MMKSLKGVVCGWKDKERERKKGRGRANIGIII